jgi:hypothetical protein
VTSTVERPRLHHGVVRDSAIRAEALTKRYGSQIALDALDLDVPSGCVFGFLGPNGAGKTTTIRLLLDLIRPSTGRAYVLGLDCQTDSLEVRRRVGYLPGDLALYDSLTGAQTLEHLAHLRGGGFLAPSLRASRTADTKASRSGTFGPRDRTARHVIVYRGPKEASNADTGTHSNTVGLRDQDGHHRCQGTMMSGQPR